MSSLSYSKVTQPQQVNGPKSFWWVKVTRYDSNNDATVKLLKHKKPIEDYDNFIFAMLLY
jgi:hypothetical protein